MRAFLLVLVCATACRAPRSSWEIRPDRAGPVRFGMSLADAQRAVGDSAGASRPTTGCTYWHPPNAPRGLSLMIEEGVVVRADVDSGGLPTTEGVGVGSTEAAIRNAYGQHLTIQLHKYQWEAGWRYFLYLPTATGDSLNAIVFETDGQRVRSYRVGRRPQVEYVERCG
jgi:hypothetical protein